MMIDDNFELNFERRVIEVKDPFNSYLEKTVPIVEFTNFIFIDENKKQIILSQKLFELIELLLHQ